MLIREGFTGMTILVILCLSNRVAGQKKAEMKLDQQDLSVLGLTIGSTRAQVEAKLGVARSSNGVREGSDELVCYRSADKDDRTVLIFHFGALGGWTDVTEISISAGSSLSLNPRSCTPNVGVSRNLRFLRGLTLGVSPAEVVRVFGPPSHAAKNKLSYYVSRPCYSKQQKTEGVKPDSGSSCVMVDSFKAQFNSESQLVFSSFYHFIDR